MLTVLKRLFGSKPKHTSIIGTTSKGKTEVARSIIETCFRKKKRSRRHSPGIPHKYNGKIKGCKRHRVLYFMDAKTAKLAQF